MGVKITDRMPAVLSAVSIMSGTRVMIGYPADEPERDPGEGEPITNAQLAYIHEHGAPEANIPARAFLVPGVESVREEAVARLKQGAREVLDGRNTIDATLTQVGLLGQNAVRRKITEGPFSPLAPATIAARKARGRTGTKPLIDTGQLRNAATFVKRKT